MCSILSSVHFYNVCEIILNLKNNGVSFIERQQHRIHISFIKKRNITTTALIIIVIIMIRELTDNRILINPIIITTTTIGT